MANSLTIPEPTSPVEEVLQDFQKARRRGEITAWVEIEARTGEWSELPQALPPQLVNGLQSRGIQRLYSHQAEAYRLVRENKNLVVVTPTASGKTLCYNLPVLDDLIRDRETRALYLFPTKALAQDQMAELRDLQAASGLQFGVHTYDGDTPGDRRQRIREDASIILTNPDMLHAGILPHHPKWVQLFQNLKYVVIDELHTYRGIFGSHVCNVLRRLKRIARFYSGEIRFICTSATIANPKELAEDLLEEKVVLLEQNGAPRSAKQLIFYNPPLINPELGIRKSALSVTRRVAERFLKKKVQTLVFTTSRVNVEVMLRYLKNAIDSNPTQPEQVRGYRGGYLPNTRRQIEKQLRKREILGVVSTNALELGIDVGSLDACILTGYPGSVASTWQQIGRAGRRSGPSAAVLVARNLPLDQFIIRNPDYFLEQTPEHGLIQPDNLQILVSHIQCAAFELPFRKEEHFGAENLIQILDFLAEQGLLQRNGEVWNWTDESYPADSVSLRNIPDENFVVFDLGENNRAIAEVDFDSAPELIHQEAIYMCEGLQYQVEKLDYKGRKAYVRGVKVDYYTEAITYSGLRILRSDDQKQSSSTRVEHGDVHLAKKFPGFKKIKFYTSENLGYGKIHLPVHELHTTSYWLTVPEPSLAAHRLSRTQVIEGFLAISYALHHIASLYLMCDLQDLGRSVGDLSARWFALNTPEGLGFYSAAGEETGHPDLCDRFDPTIFLYDNYPGGIGFSETLFENHDRLMAEAMALIQNCDCHRGCPSCVGPIGEVSPQTKQISLVLLGGLNQDRT